MINIKKISLRILFCMVLLFLALMIKSSVFAATDTNFDINSLPDFSSIVGDNDYFIRQIDDKYYLHFVDGATILVGYHNGYPAIYADWGHTCYTYLFTISSSTDWELIYSAYKECSPYVTYNSFSNWGDVLVYSNYDVYDNSGNLVFQQPPLEVEVVPETVLAPIVEEKKETMGTVLQEIVSILPMILVVVVSLVGLRKALSMLSVLLHQS